MGGRGWNGSGVEKWWGCLVVFISLVFVEFEWVVVVVVVDGEGRIV